MATNYRFSGKKGERKVIKTIDIAEESYKGIKGMIDRGLNLSDAVNVPLISDTYNMFGGNCYGMLVSMAIEQMICAIVHQLEVKKLLLVDGALAYQRISGIILPLMCYTSDGEEYTEELRFFNQDEDEIVDVIKDCLNKQKAEWFKTQLDEAMKEDSRPVGEIATGILMYIASESEDVDNNDDTLVS